MAPSKDNEFIVPFQSSETDLGQGSSRSELDENLSVLEKSHILQAYSGDFISRIAQRANALETDLLIAGKQDLAVNDCLMKQVQSLKNYLEHIRHNLDSLENLELKIEYREVDLVSLLKQIWSNCASAAATIEFDCDHFPVQVDSGQMTLAISLLLDERLSHATCFSCSLVQNSQSFELEISDDGEWSDKDSIAKSIARQVIKNHGGQLELLNCPQGGIAISIKILNRRISKAA